MFVCVLWFCLISICCLTPLSSTFPPLFLPPRTVQARTGEYISHTASSIVSSRLIDRPRKNHSEAEQRIESQRSDLSRQSPRAMLQEDGPHLFALTLKFPLIHRKTNDHCLAYKKTVRMKLHCFYISQNNNEDKTVRIIPNSGRSFMRSGLFCTDKSSTCDVFVFKLAAITIRFKVKNDEEEEVPHISLLHRSTEWSVGHVELMYRPSALH